MHDFGHDSSAKYGPHMREIQITLFPWPDKFYPRAGAQID